MSDPTLFVDHPSVAGTVITEYWARLNPSSGVYAWEIIDGYIKPWADAGKQIILRVSAAGHADWQKNLNSGNGTPQWVYDQGVKSVIDDDGSVKPEYWNPKFLSSLTTFVEALAARYDGNKSIFAVEIGVGDGGETKPDTSKGSDVLKKWQAVGYMDGQWWGAIQQIIQAYVLAFTKTPLVLMPNSSFIGGTKGYDEALVTQYAAKYNCGLQWNGLVAGAKLPGSFAGLKVPILCEQLNAAGANKRRLADDLQTAVDLGGAALLVFTSDLQDPANAATLQKFTAK